MARILIVDDSMFQRLKVGEILRKAGHEVLEASGGQDGLEVAVEARPDGMILDLLMPKMDGFEVMERLRDKGLEIPVIVLTADIQETTRQRCRQLGAREVLNKPPKERDLIEAVNKALGD